MRYQHINSLLIGSMVFIGCSTTPSGLRDSASNGSDTLIGGTQAADSDFPSTLLILDGCTAAKVGDHQILTAAHCVHDTQKDTVDAGYVAGATIQVTTAKKVTPENRAEVSIRLTVVKTEIHPQWLTDCTPGCSVNVLGANVPSDVAVITVEEDTPAIPVATVDLDRVDQGESLAIMGYGCDERLGKPYDYANRSLKYQTTKALGGEALAHPGSYIPPGDERFDKLMASYFLTPGQKSDRNEASLCPGDSGGPVYRDDGTQSVVVGVNAYYTFTGNSGVSVTNWHTRLDQGSRFEIGAWLEALGVQVITSKGGSNADTSGSSNGDGGAGSGGGGGGADSGG
jgi:hypothetical protein